MKFADGQPNNQYAQRSGFLPAGSMATNGEGEREREKRAKIIT